MSAVKDGELRTYSSEELAGLEKLNKSQQGGGGKKTYGRLKLSPRRAKVRASFGPRIGVRSFRYKSF